MPKWIKDIYFNFSKRPELRSETLYFWHRPKDGLRVYPESYLYEEQKEAEVQKILDTYRGTSII